MSTAAVADIGTACGTGGYTSSPPTEPQERSADPGHWQNYQPPLTLSSLLQARSKSRRGCLILPPCPPHFLRTSESVKHPQSHPKPILPQMGSSQDGRLSGTGKGTGCMSSSAIAFQTSLNKIKIRGRQVGDKECFREPRKRMGEGWAKDSDGDGVGSDQGEGSDGDCVGSDQAEGSDGDGAGSGLG